mmetsp:Transcript_22284/g.53445  ORF Transcript_22284/g.53445 Transcript_22284/m.53445 type:complete len:362 (-) Transcript_22284:4281-5366(-)
MGRSTTAAGARRTGGRPPVDGHGGTVVIGHRGIGGVGRRRCGAGCGAALFGRYAHSQRSAGGPAGTAGRTTRALRTLRPTIGCHRNIGGHLAGSHLSRRRWRRGRASLARDRGEAGRATSGSTLQLASWVSFGGYGDRIGGIGIGQRRGGGQACRSRASACSLGRILGRPPLGVASVHAGARRLHNDGNQRAPHACDGVAVGAKQAAAGGKSPPAGIAGVHGQSDRAPASSCSGERARDELGHVEYRRREDPQRGGAADPCYAASGRHQYGARRRKTGSGARRRHSVAVHGGRAPAQRVTSDNGSRHYTVQRARQPTSAAVDGGGNRHIDISYGGYASSITRTPSTVAKGRQHYSRGGQRR